jgi:hypothetical protein
VAGQQGGCRGPLGNLKAEPALTPHKVTFILNLAQRADSNQS